MKLKTIIALPCLVCLFIQTNVKVLSAPVKDNTNKFRVYEVRDDKPASQWEYGYPVGNGRLGAMPFGDYPNEQILLNDETIWQGRNSMQNRTDLMFIVEDVRKLLWENKYEDAHNMINKDLLVPRITPRSYQPMGYLHIDYDAFVKASGVKKFSRLLSMNDALATSEITLENGNIIKQEVFVSHPNDVIVVKITSKIKGGLSFSIGLDRYASFETKSIGNHMLTMEGLAQNETVDRELLKEESTKRNRGTSFCTLAKISNEDGRIRSNGNRIDVNKASAVTILITSSTDYNYGNPFLTLRHDRLETCLEKLSLMEKFNYEELKSKHIADHQSLFNRATIDLGKSSKKTLKTTTPERIKAFNLGAEDPDLLEDLFQMGRYMLIASSRKGCLPATLTGVWNGNPNPVCHSDWHTNINVQENYWHAELTNLSELHEPFIKLLDDIRIGQGKALAEKLGCRGFLVTHATHAWEESAFSGDAFWGMWPMGGAWSVSHTMEHYRFTQDKDYLKCIAYPILKDNILFCLDWLVAHPESGELVSGPSASPENGFYVGDSKTIINACMGPTVDHQIIYESFTDFLEASKILDIDDELTKQVKNVKDKVAKTKIASDGRIMEWDKEYKEWQVTHRHYSHLYALYPGCEIDKYKTPDLFEAAKKSVAVRQTNGGVPYGWSRAHLLNLYARLEDGSKAYGTIQYLLKNNTLPNLMHTQPPVFFDGNGAGTAGFVEMLMQSQGVENIIKFLPALPGNWLSGTFMGLCARGGFEIDLDWDKSKPVRATVYSRAGQSFKVEADAPITVTSNDKKQYVKSVNGYQFFATKKGESYVIEF